ncbi:MAG: NAD(P)/FAD-dependent oxidoreductase [Pirellulales bacterium]|nr:NAD(P)/FAD-dependent oxidoreductase [Pirellulales bacterium]
MSSDHPPSRQHIDVVIVGGGQAGLSLSYFLGQAGIGHVVLERDIAFSAWHHRWDSFRMNTANWMNVLPGSKRQFAPGQPWYEVADRQAVLSYLTDYRNQHPFPIKEGCEVMRVEQLDPEGWVSHCEHEAFQSRVLVMCNGHAAQPKIPDVARHLPDHVRQLHSSDYRRPDQIRSGRVLVVGSGSSGIQICRDLAGSKRFHSVHLATSGNKVIPWRWWGLPIAVYARLLRVFDVRRDGWLGRYLGFDPHRGDAAMAPSPRELARRWQVHLVGKAKAVDENQILFEDQKTLALDDLTIVWCTGYRTNHSFLKVKRHSAVFDALGPIECRGVAEAAPGLYFLGLKFQHTVGSHLLYGIGRDARYVGRHIERYLTGRSSDDQSGPLSDRQ